MGSSPLARGLHEHAWTQVSVARIIPARAGFTYWDANIQIAVKDHPRSRGVYNSTLKRALTRVGSSPLARGLRQMTKPEISDLRIIPARAGFT